CCPSLAYRIGRLDLRTKGRFERFFLAPDAVGLLALRRALQLALVPDGSVFVCAGSDGQTNVSHLAFRSAAARFLATGPGEKETIPVYKRRHRPGIYLKSA